MNTDYSDNGDSKIENLLLRLEALEHFPATFTSQFGKLVTSNLIKALLGALVSGVISALVIYFYQ